ncbi:hypothetical protein [Providencia sp. PROV114]|uniref:hypothetical protein n=1 Tax=Providencia sp. PROV114 TaxID=2949825 RepID=UPI002349D364|nr:hypothetical protein [Providencia sp. PROV114]WOB81882.1 hypothetical protein P3L37_19685 [Providencia sp. PROV114]
MSQSYRYWTGNLYTGSTVFIQHQDGHLSKGEVVNVAEQRFIVAGISSPFDKFTATSIEGVVALPDEYDVRERYSIQQQRDYLDHLDIATLSSHQVNYIYAGLHLAKRAGGGALPGMPVTETPEGIHRYIQELNLNALSELQVMYMLTGLKIAKND